MILLELETRARSTGSPHSTQTASLLRPMHQPVSPRSFSASSTLHTPCEHQTVHRSQYYRRFGGIGSAVAFVQWYTRDLNPVLQHAVYALHCTAPVLVCTTRTVQRLYLYGLYRKLRSTRVAQKLDADCNNLQEQSGNDHNDCT